MHMQPILTFASLSMCMVALTALLPERSPLRKTALLACGLLMAAMWLDSLSALLPHLRDVQPPASLLTPTQAASIDQRQQALLSQWQEDEP